MLRERYRIARELSAQTLTIVPPSGRGLVVTDIIIVSPTAFGYATIKVGTEIIGYYMYSDDQFNHLGNIRSAWPPNSVNFIPDFTYATPRVHLGSANPSLIQQAHLRGIPLQIPVPQDDVFSVECDAAVYHIIVTYEEWDAEDINPEMPNHPDGNVRIFPLYFTNSVDLTASGYHRVDTMVTPPEFGTFPILGPVPDQSKYLLHAVFAADYMHNEWVDPDNYGAFTLDFRLWKDQEILFSRDFNGILCYGGGADDASTGEMYFGGISHAGWGGLGIGSPLWFPEPIPFIGGEEMLIQFNVEVDNASYPLDAEKIMIGCLFERHLRVE